MKIKRFALGIRFDTLKDTVEPSDIDAILSELTDLLSVKDVEDLVVSGGVCRISPDDSEGVYTVVFTNGGLKKMRALYSKINDDARLHAMLDQRTPYIQNNIVRSFEGEELFGAVEKDGRCTGGSGRDVVFGTKPSSRALYDGNCILIAINSFKGTIPADSAARHVMRAIRERLPELTCIPVPAADGGDGTLSALEKGMLCQRHSMTVCGPYSQKIKCDYLVADGIKAMIESALASGLALCGGAQLDPLIATSYGTGELIMRAAHEGLSRIYVCLGGSATNDCGIGLARATGVRFLDSEDNEVVSACDMERIVRIDDSNMDEQVKQAEIIAVCDVDNPLTGENGATYVFGPQKGADKDALLKLESGMKNMEELLDGYAGRKVCSEPGAGAAGGIGAMLKALFNAKAIPGADAILEISDFDRLLKKASLVVTGEGRIDETSLHGKAVGAVIEHAHAAGVPVAIIAGSRGEGFEKVETLANMVEYSGSEEDAYTAFDAAAERLAEDIAEVFKR